MSSSRDTTHVQKYLCQSHIQFSALEHFFLRRCTGALEGSFLFYFEQLGQLMMLNYKTLGIFLVFNKRECQELGS